MIPLCASRKANPLSFAFMKSAPCGTFFIAKADICNPLLIALRSPAGDLTDSRQIRCFERHILWFPFRIFHTQALISNSNFDLLCSESAFYLTLNGGRLGAPPSVARKNISYVLSWSFLHLLLRPIFCQSHPNF